MISVNIYINKYITNPGCTLTLREADVSSEFRVPSSVFEIRNSKTVPSSVFEIRNSEPVPSSVFEFRNSEPVPSTVFEKKYKYVIN